MNQWFFIGKTMVFLISKNMVISVSYLSQRFYVYHDIWLDRITEIVFRIVGE